MGKQVFNTSGSKRPSGGTVSESERVASLLRNIINEGVVTLKRLSEKDAVFRELVRDAIPQIVALLSHRELKRRRAGTDALLILSEQAEFRESIRAIIPQVIALLSHSMPYVCSEGADTLVKLSEQAEFRESIKPAIPQMIVLLRSQNSDVSKGVVNALVKLSEQAEFRESIQSAISLSVVNMIHQAGAQISGQVGLQGSVDAISQQTTFLSGGDVDKDIHMADVAASEQGTNVDSTSDMIVDSDKLEHSWTTTYWIAAEHALKHARNNISLVSKIFDRWKIQEFEYVVHAGFDESLIKSGVGYLEQIHVFVSAEVDTASQAPLLSELGRLFSPFSSTLFTESSSYRLPVFKDDGSVWEFDERIYFTSSIFHDGGSSAKAPLTIISLSQTPNLGDSTTGFSQSSSGSGEGEKNEKWRLEKGKERDMGDKDEANKGSDDPEDPPGDQGGIIVGPAEIFFEIASEIYPVDIIQDKQSTFQTLTMHGSLTIETVPLAQNPPRFSERFVQFTELTFDTEPPTDMIAYKQFHLRVDVDSQQKNAHVKVIKPKRTSDSDRDEKQSSSTKSGGTRGMTAGLTLGPHPQATMTGTVMKTYEENVGSEKKRYNSAITEHHSDGNVRWGFNIDDVNLRKFGIDIQEDELPTVRFKFVGYDKVPAPPPKDMDIVVTSYWSMILPSELKSTWIHKLLHFFRPTGNTQTISYSNLFQIVALKADLSGSPELSYYKARVKVRSGACSPPDVERQAAESVKMTLAVIDPRKLNPPMIERFRLSDNCIPILGCDSKSH